MQARHQAIPDAITRGTLHPLPAGTSIGVLLLHGFTSSLSAVSGFVPFLTDRGIDYEMPVLRGHNATPEALIGVRASDWYDDAYAALEKLAQRVDRVVIVGLSMGGVTTLQLCAKRHPCSPKIAAAITWAPALAFVNPLAKLAIPLSHFVKFWHGQDSFRDPECRRKCENYSNFPTKSFVELLHYAKETSEMLDDVEVPLCIVHSERDQVIPYKRSKRLFDDVSSAYVELHTLHASGHELGQDCEANRVFEISIDFIERLIDKASSRCETSSI